MFTSVSALYSLSGFSAFSRPPSSRIRRQTKDHRVHCPVKFELPSPSLSLSLPRTRRRETREKAKASKSHPNRLTGRVETFRCLHVPGDGLGIIAWKPPHSHLSALLVPFAAYWKKKKKNNTPPLPSSFPFVSSISSFATSLRDIVLKRKSVPSGL